MDSKNNREKIKALRAFLGLANRIPSKGEGLAFFNELQKMRQKKEMPSHIRKQAWDNIKKGLAEEKAGAIEEKQITGRFFSFPLLSIRQYSIAASLVILIAFGGLYYSDFFSTFKGSNESEISKVLLSPGIISVDGKILQGSNVFESALFEQKDIALLPFSWKKKTPCASHIGKNVNIWIREIFNLKGENKENGLALFLSHGKILIQHREANNSNEKKYFHKVKTPNFTFEILGTEFILEVTKKNASILMGSGIVRVIANNRKWDKPGYRILPGGYYWSDVGRASLNLTNEQKLPEPVKISGIRIAKIISKFKDKHYSFISLQEFFGATQKIDKKNINRGKKSKSIELILKSGEVLKGKVLIQDSKKIILRTNLGKIFEIKRAEIERIQ